MKIDDIRPSNPTNEGGEAPSTNTENFQTPEEASATDHIEQEATLPTASLAEENSNDNMSSSTPSKPKQGARFERFALHWPPGKKEWAVFAIVVLLLILGLTIFLIRHHPKPVVITKAVPIVPAKPVTVASRLTGVQVSPALAKLPVTGIMIENSDQARPQSSLSQAGVVYEALAEGGITRFLALYEEGQPTSIGPIRSARPYFIDWLLPFDASYAHVGGSPQALSEIQSLNVKDMDEFSHGGNYTRISTRAAPHNVYTSMTSLSSLEQSKGWTTMNFTGFPRKADAPSKAPTASTINFNIAGPDMAVNYVYDAKLNSYKRSEGGAPMVDANTSQQLEPKVVIAIVVPWVNGPLDASGAHYTAYSDVGSGTAYVFQDGTVTQGVWLKSTQASQIQFDTANGAVIKLNPGQTWISAVGTTPEVTYN
ncbi:MAG TPA: DUF3048 domain-containing protein [Candidatus Dormibacteraeota bacterium]|nr:DUF3048 domain-containing protein [Candidatus Dormibacteraeota bacterium]